MNELDLTTLSKETYKELENRVILIIKESRRLESKNELTSDELMYIDRLYVYFQCLQNIMINFSFKMK
jgi:hypothetical protein